MGNAHSRGVPWRRSLPWSTDPLWTGAVAAGVVLCTFYAALPERYFTLRELVLYTLGEIGAIAAILLGVRRHRPSAPAAWLLIAAALSSWTIGDVLFTVYQLIGRNPFPSVADAFYLIGYPVFGAGVLVATHRRAPWTDRRALIDAAIITVSAGMLAWVYVIKPYAIDQNVGVLATAVSIAYPLGDLLLLAVTARFLMGAEWRLPALRLLALGLLLTLVADILYAMTLADASDAITRLLNTMLLTGMVIFGLAGLHPSMSALTRATKPTSARLAPRRLMLVAAVCLMPAAVLTIQGIRGAPLYLPVTIGALVILWSLVAVRFADVTMQAHRAAENEARLRRHAAELLRSSGREELFAIAERTARAPLGRGEARLVPPGHAGPTDTIFNKAIKVDGEVVAELVANASASRLSWVRGSLATVANQLSLALGRERLLEMQRAATAALAAQNEQLVELDHMKDQFVSSVSHELRTPLTSIGGYLELLLDGEAGDLTEEQRRMLEIVNRNCGRLNRVVDDILFVSRADAGRLSIEREPVDIAELVRRAEELARPAAERKGLTLRFSADDDVPQLSADPTRLAQLLDNLLSNAVKFTPAGGTVTVAVERRDHSAHLRISDTGVGIPEVEAQRLFERFFRASTAASAPGTGLGLTIVKSIVDLHSGTIAVESREGVGTTFHIDLPLPSQPAPAAAGAVKERLE